jgi:hypothetical protein
MDEAGTRNEDDLVDRAGGLVDFDHDRHRPAD